MSKLLDVEEGRRRGSARRRTTIIPRNLPGGPQATDLSAALMSNSRDRALSILLQANADGWEIRDVEEVIIAPAVSRLGELWLRGRIDDTAFERIGSLAESVEIAYRRLVLQPAGRLRARREMVAHPR